MDLDKTFDTRPTSTNVIEVVEDFDGSGFYSASVFLGRYAAVNGDTVCGVFLSVLCSFFWLSLTPMT